MKRFFDIFFAIILIPLVIIPLVIITIFIRLTSEGPVIHWSKRIGQYKKIFLMPKFRTMNIDTPDKATHLLEDPSSFFTPIGSLLRKTSLDEIPQLWSILIGDMSFVGPRPALYNQNDLIALREKRGINSIIPGITGWAQINGRDDITIEEKVKLDSEYLRKASLFFDMLIILRTASKVFKATNVSH